MFSSYSPSMSQLKPRVTTAAWNGAFNSIAAVTGVPRVFAEAAANEESSAKKEATDGGTQIDYFDFDD